MPSVKKPTLLGAILATAFLLPGTLGAAPAGETSSRTVEGVATVDWSGGGNRYDLGHFLDVGFVRIHRTETTQAGDIVSFRVEVDYEGPAVVARCVNDNGHVTGTIALRAVLQSPASPVIGRARAPPRTAMASAPAAPSPAAATSSPGNPGRTS